LNQNYVWKREKVPTIRIRPFKEKEKEGGEERSQLGGQWKVLMLGGQWKQKEKHLFTSFHFPQQILLKPSFFQ
jgi:hypothetical protein